MDSGENAILLDGVRHCAAGHAQIGGELCGVGDFELFFISHIYNCGLELIKEQVYGGF